MSEILREQLLQSGILASAALLTALFVIRFLVGRALKRGEGFPPLVVRRWTASLRNVLILVAIVGLVMIWAPQLRTFALSLTAFAVASVIAMKELIMCFSGSALRTLSRAYSVGDYIEIGGKRGEVMDFNLLVTRLREFEKQDGSFNRTGREVILPHSLLLSSPVRVEGHAGGRVRHVFSMTFEPDANLFAERAAIEEAALAAYAGTAAGHSKRQRGALAVSRTEDDRPPSITVSVGTSDIGKYRLEIVFYSKPELVGDAERAIASRIGDRVHNLRTAGKVAVRKES